MDALRLVILFFVSIICRQLVAIDSSTIISRDHHITSLKSKLERKLTDLQTRIYNILTKLNYPVDNLHQEQERNAIVGGKRIISILESRIRYLELKLDEEKRRHAEIMKILQEQEGMSQQSVTRVRRFQRELRASKDRADFGENNLSLIYAKHRSFITTSNVPGSQVYLVQESRAL